MVNASNIEFKTTHGIIPALDVASLDEAVRLVAGIREVPGVVGYKLGATLSLRLGLNRAVSELKKHTDLPIIYDHQKAGADVPDMAEKYAAACSEAGLSALILFPLAGPRAVRAFTEGALRRGMLPIVGGDLPFADYNISGGGYVADDALQRIIQEAVAAGAKHFVVPGNTDEKVRRHAQQLQECLDDPALVIPGIGALGGSIEKSFSAASGCRAYAVIGRAIYAAPDPQAAAKHLAGEALRFA